jgi:hypothetical protein
LQGGFYINKITQRLYHFWPQHLFPLVELKNFIWYNSKYGDDYMKNEKTAIFGYINIFLMAIVNFANAFWTLWLTIEQLATGWGFPTYLEMGVLWPWIFEVLSLPFIILCLAFLILSIFKKTKKWVVIANSILLAFAILQIVLTNLFIWY